MASVPPYELTGKLLMAMPAMTDPRFARSVIYLCSHGPNGAMGLIVNKPRPDIRFARILDSLSITPRAILPDVRVHYGGPVEHGRGFVLHSPDYGAPPGTLEVTKTVSMTATLDIMQDIAAGKGPKAAMFALGYAGWAAGQLESEIARNDWLTADPRADILFGRADEFKWTAALRQIGVDPVNLSGAAGRA